jgi:serine-protein kinase ATM
LLFLIDRHWSEFHDILQTKIFDVVREQTSNDDLTIQSWAFVCQAALAYVARSTPIMKLWDWDGVWTYTFRRTNTPGACRAACHSAQVLLVCRAINPNRVLKDIEVLANDLSVQGPSFPYDSVCTFFGHCARLASSDVRLYKLQLDEKILSWLVESWNVVNGTTVGFNSRSRVEAHSMNDVLVLVRTLCGLPRPNELLYGTILPECAIVNALVEEQRTAVVHRYMLDARISTPAPASAVTLSKVPEDSLANNLEKPTSRAVKFSTFLEKSLKNLQQEWEAMKDLHSSATPEKIRRTIDAIVLALSFQMTLLLNGFRDTRRVLESACKLIEVIRPTLAWKRWTPEQRSLILTALVPITRGHDPFPDPLQWEPLAEPDHSSGIHRKILISMRSKLRQDIRKPSLGAEVREGQSLLWERSVVSAPNHGTLCVWLMSNSDFKGSRGF